MLTLFSMVYWRIGHLHYISSSRSKPYPIVEIESLLLHKRKGQRNTLDILIQRQSTLLLIRNITEEETTELTSTPLLLHNFSTIKIKDIQMYKNRYPHSGRHPNTRNFNHGGRNSWNTTNNSWPQCQLRGKNGHTALDCWNHLIMTSNQINQPCLQSLVAPAPRLILIGSQT